MRIRPTIATDRQLEVLGYIEKYYNENCRAPSIRDIGEHFSFSPKAAYDHVHALNKKGYIRKESTARSIIIIKKTGA